MTRTAAEPRAARSTPGLLSGALRVPTVGLLLVVTLIAFEAMAVATAMPTAVRELDGLDYYAWTFSSFLVASVVGIVLAGARSHRRGPAGPLLGGLGLFVAGLLLAGGATAMALFVVGRAVQGLGAGMILVAVYVLIAQVYDEALRPQVFAALSAAWVLPALIGPVLAGALTEAVSWRVVFLGLPPLVAVGLVLLVPVLRSLPSSGEEVSVPRDGGRRTRLAVQVAVGVGLLQYAGQDLRPASLLLAAAGAALVVPGVRHLLPAGTLALARGLPAVVGFRGLASGSFFGAEAFLPLALSTVHGYSPVQAGVPLTVGALGWSAGSWWQGRHRGVARSSLVRVGFGFICCGLAALSLLAVPGLPGWVALPGWTLAGAGMGLAMPAISVLLLELSPNAEQGRNAAALQVSDVLGGVLGVGVAGVLVATLREQDFGLTVVAVDLTMAALALVGALTAGRSRALTLDRS